MKKTNKKIKNEIVLLGRIITDKEFAKKIINKIEPNDFYYFKLKQIFAIIKDAYEMYEIVINIDSLIDRIYHSVDNKNERKDLLREVFKIERSINIKDVSKLYKLIYN